jgi:hypothetical protein
VEQLTGAFHYVSIYQSSGNNGHQYVEVQDGLVLANFDPLLDVAPEVVTDFFLSGEKSVATRYAMVKAVEYRMETEVREEWLADPTTTYLIDYNTRAD